MTGVESAASLFGSDESGPDPFASLGSDPAEHTSTQSSHDAGGQGPLESEQNYNVAADLFGQDDSSASAAHSTWSGSTSQDPYAYDASTHSQEHPSANAYGDQYAQGWYDEHGQWQTYETSHTDHTTQDHHAYPYQNAPSNGYDPYTPQSGNAYAPSKSQQAVYSQSHYDPYQPAAPMSTNNHTPAPAQTQAASASAYSYNPYTPSTSAYTSSTSAQYAPATSNSAYPNASYPNAPPAKSTPPVASPASPSASSFRPKTSNAYDPPLPPPRASKRAVSAAAARPGRTASPAVGQQTYPVYDTSSLPPPPPIPSQYAPPAAQNSSAYDRYSPAPDANHTYNNGTNNNGVGTAYHPSTSDYPAPSDSAPGSNASSLYQTPASGYEPLHTPPPASDLWDEAPTPRQPPNGTYYTSETDSPVTSGQPHDPVHYGHNEDSGYGSTAVEDVFGDAAPLDPEGGEPQAPPPPRTQSPYGATRPASGGPSQIERTGSPAWSSSPRASPDLNRGQGAKSLSPPPQPSNYAAYRSNSYDPKVANRSSSPVGEPARSWTDAYAPQNSNSSPPVFTQPPTGTIPRVSSPLANGAAVSDPYAPKASAQAKLPNTGPYGAPARTTSPSKPSNVSQTVYDPYAPKSNGQVTNPYEPKAAGSTSPPSSWQSAQPRSDPYAPQTVNPYKPTQSRDRSASNGSSFNGTSGPYAPSQQGWQQQQPLQAPQLKNNNYYGHSAESSYEGMPSDSSVGQDIFLAPSTQTPYAPSPSLLGSNDPLGRTAARIPVFSFGFGGKLVTCFHGSAMSGGFDVALSSRQSTDIQIRTLQKVLPESALDNSSATYPGPLFADPGSPTNSLVRTTASQTKAKKAKVVTYLEERASEIDRGIGYLHLGSDDRRSAEGKLVLVKLLKVMVEQDGQLTGSAQTDAAVRAALIPRLVDTGVAVSPESSFTTPALTFSPPTADSLSSLSLGSDLGESPIATSSLRPATLAKIQEFLLRGERRQAYHIALDEKLWAHAMVIASSIDKDAWKEVVNEFIHSELGVKDDGHRATTRAKPNEPPATLTNGREWLKVAYSLFSGQGPAAVQELLPPNQLSRTLGGLQVPGATLSHITPMSPNFPSAEITAKVPVESLSKWPETAAVMINSPMAPDTSAALTALGDYLVSNGWIEAAHACYLLSPITSPIGGLHSPSTRLVLLGSRSPHHWPIFYKDSDPLIFSEIAEFAMSLATPPKGQEPFHGIPHLQAYKLIRAASLAEIGQVDIAKRYCEAIATSLGRNSPYFTVPFVEQLRGLTDQLTAAPHLDKGGSWIGGKMSKPSLDSIGGWLEGRLTKFIAGDGDSPQPNQPSFPQGNQTGVFTHYSTISSTTSSASPSPQPTQINNNTFPGAPPRRSGSAMASHSSAAANAYTPIDRASSAMEYSRPLQPPSTSQKVASAGPGTTTFAQSRSFGQAVNGYGATNGHVSNYSNETVSPKALLEESNEEGGRGQEATWWGASSYGDDASGQTPTASTFLKVDEPALSTTSSGFISLMDDHSFSVSPSPSVVSRQLSSSTVEEEDEEDLGFGNSKKSKKEESDEGAKKAEASKPAAPERPDIQPQQAAAASSSSGSWLGRFWKRSDSSTPGPVKASLGEETSFVYDKDLKKWVNKKAGSEPAKPAAPPPPPSRAQTASPGRSNPIPPPSSLTPPPARPASAIDLSVSPPTSRTVPRARSNLVPSEPGTPPPPASPGLGGSLAPPGPPPGRPKSSASKRNIRSRYVDILQDGGA